MPVDKIKTVVTFTTVKILKEKEKNLISYPKLSIKNIKVSKGKKNVRKSLDHFKAKKVNAFRLFSLIPAMIISQKCPV